jgi:predicted anti-sigma-YlaC factor YlaD
MKISPKAPEHWTDEQLIASLYGAGPENGHLRECAECQERLFALEANRQALERETADDVNFAYLAAQRRRIYARLAEPARPWSGLSVRRWASAVVALLVLGSGFVVIKQYRHEQAESKISDIQLAQEMSRISQGLEAQPVAPLQGLFE